MTLQCPPRTPAGGPNCCILFVSGPLENRRRSQAGSLRQYVRAPASRTPQCQEPSGRRLLPQSSRRRPASRPRHPSPQCPPSPSLRAPHHALELLRGATGRLSAQLANPLQVSPSWDAAEAGNAPFPLNTADVATPAQPTPSRDRAPAPAPAPSTDATSRSADPSGGCRVQHQGVSVLSPAVSQPRGPGYSLSRGPASVHVPSDSRSCCGP